MNNEAAEFQEITPGQDFLDGLGYVTIPILEIVDGIPQWSYHVITSRREKFLLTDKEMAQRGLYSGRLPRPTARWGAQALNEYLTHKRLGNLTNAIAYIREQFDDYIDFGDPRCSAVLACWVMGTYWHRLFDSFPYVQLNGNLASGKSKTLTLTTILAFNGEHIVNGSASYIVRTINDNHSTLCIDEAENLKKVKDSDTSLLIGMLNAGYKKGAFVGKSEQVGKLNQWRPARFDAYSPKMFAGIGGLEASLASRCIPITMVRSSNQAIINHELSLVDPIFAGIRAELYQTMLDWYLPIEALNKALQDDLLVGREWEIWRPLLVIAKSADPEGKLYEEVRSFALETQDQKQETTMQDFLAPKLLATLAEFLGKEGVDTGEFTADQIIGFLSDSDEESFGWLREHKGKGRWLGDQLRKAGVVKTSSTPKKLDGKTVRVYAISLAVVQQRLEAHR